MSPIQGPKHRSRITAKHPSPWFKSRYSSKIGILWLVLAALAECGHNEPSKRDSTMTRYGCCALLVLLVIVTISCRLQSQSAMTSGYSGCSDSRRPVDTLLHRSVFFKEDTIAKLKVPRGTLQSDWAENRQFVDSCRVRLAGPSDFDFVPVTDKEYRITDFFNDPNEISVQGLNKIFVVTLCEPQSVTSCPPSRFALACFLVPAIDYSPYRIARPLSFESRPSPTDGSTGFHDGAMVVQALTSSIPYEPTEEQKSAKEESLKGHIATMANALRTVLCLDQT